jgi:amidase
VDGFFAERTLGELAAGVRDGRWTAAELVELSLGALAAAHERTGCVAALDAERARATAERLDDQLRSGRPPTGPLHGVPFTAKDWLDAEGLPGTGGWIRHRDRRPDRDATAVARLRSAGAVLVAKTAPLAESELYGVVRNPHDPDRSPGASSSGEGAAVGAGASPLGLGSDSGGSVRLPAAWCGVAGLKPTAGRVPTTGHFPRVGPHGDGRTQVGPLVRHAADLDLVLRAIQGPDGRDPGVAPVPLAPAAGVDIAGLRVGWSAGEPGWETHPAIATAVRRAMDRLTALGAHPAGEVALGLDESLDVTERYWGRAGLSGEEVGRQLADWDRYARRALRVFAGVDAVVLPATRDLPPPLRPLAGADYVYTLPASLTGGPAAVVPVAHHDGLPVAVQVLAAPWRDDIAVAVAATLRS